MEKESITLQLTCDRTLKHAANAVMMVRPVHFNYNPETAIDNEFQNDISGQSNLELITQRALSEFAQSVDILQQEGVSVIILDGEDSTDSCCVQTPDSVFPNNWFGTTSDGKIIVYPMATENRRAETRRLPDVLQLLDRHQFMYDSSPLILENEHVLEGTGAMVMDHVHGVIYAARSVRCNPKALKAFTSLRSNQFVESIMFETYSSSGKEIYHTNVMMSIGTHFAVVCSDSISENPACKDCQPRSQVLKRLSQTRTVIEITREQAERFFCANILELRGENNEPKIVMSTSAWKGFTPDQKAKLASFGKLVPIPISDVIEFVGGGSARCMLAEIFLPRKNSE